MIWENPEGAEKLKKDVENRIKNLQDQNTSHVTYLEQNDNLTEDAIKTYNQLIAENNEKINLLSKSLETMQKISDDKERTYSLSPVDKNSVHGVVLDSDGTINIQTSSPSLALHEITHIGQSLDVGELKFDNNMLLNASTELGRVVGNELKAYRTQFAMDPLNMPLPVVSINSVTPTYLKAIVNPYTGNPLYDFIP